MAKKRTVKEVKAGTRTGKIVNMPEAAAHIVSRELRFTPDQLAKLQAALDANLPLKMNIGLHSKIWSVSLSTTARMALMQADSPPKDDGDIVNEPMEPPDDGGNIPTDPEEPPPPPPPEEDGGGKPVVGRQLVGATVKIYAVAVFRPEFARPPGDT